MADRAPWRRLLTRYAIRPLETTVLQVVHGIFSVLPIDTASALGGAAGRLIGPRLKLSRRARRNLARVFPDLDAAQIEQIVREMWDNLGRVAAELPHLPQIKVLAEDRAPGPRRLEIVGTEHIHAARDSGKPVIFFTAHIGNWEVGPLGTMRHGLPLHVVYRSSNNIHADKIFLGGRRDVVSDLIPKGAEGARRMLKVLQGGEALGMLVDQKMNDGIAVPFFGRDAMTAPALAQLALKFDCIVLPAWVERLDGAYYRLTIEPPMALPRTGDRHADIRAIMTEVNARMESWIRRKPGQWLWLHRRWPD